MLSGVADLSVVVLLELRSLTIGCRNLCPKTPISTRMLPINSSIASRSDLGIVGRCGALPFTILSDLLDLLVALNETRGNEYALSLSFHLYL